MSLTLPICFKWRLIPTCTNLPYWQSYWLLQVQSNVWYFMFIPNHFLFSKKNLCFLTDKKNQLCFTEMSHLCSRQHAGIRWWIKNCVIFKYFVPFNTVFSHNLYHPFWFEYSLMTGQLNFFWGNLVFKFQLCPHREQWLDLWT